jgi:Tol biopolymer transport system component
MTIQPLCNPRRNLAALAALMALAACGGSSNDPTDDGNQQGQTDNATNGNGKRQPPRPPPPPAPPPPPPPPSPSPPVDSTVVGALALASSNAAGQAAGGSLCGISADGNLIAFNSDSGSLVAGDTNGANDVFVKNLRTGGVQRASASGGTICRQMTPDGRLVLMSAADGAVLVKNLSTGVLTQVSPAANSIPNNQGFSAGSISDDGTKVALVTVPTTIYVGAYSYVNTVPARIVIKNLSDGSLVTLPTDNGNVAQGEIVLGHLNARLSPDGSRIAFVSSSSTLVGGDTNGQPDIFVRDLATGATTLASSNSSGTPATLSVCCHQSYYKVEWASNTLLQFVPDQPSSLGERGEYVKNVGTGELRFLLSPGNETGAAEAVLAADGTKLIYSRFYGNGFDRRVFVRDLATGAEKVVSSSSGGTAGNGNNTLFGGGISRDGARVVFSSNATNLFSPAPPTGSYQVYVKTIDTP